MVEYGYCHCGCGQKTAIAKKNRQHYGIKRGDPSKYIQGHCHKEMLLLPDYQVEDRGYVSPCWSWIKVKNQYGYGRMRVNGKLESAHRIYYEHKYGTIQLGLQIDHLCKNPACVNPDHMEPVTQAENLRRGKQCKLNPDKVREIRSLYPFLTISQIANRFGVSYSTISAIFHGRAWQEA